MKIPASLRFRLMAGASAIALIAVFAALLAAYGASETAGRIDQSVAAQRRIDILSTLSARVGDYAVVAVEAAATGAPADVRSARLESRAALVDDVFARMDAALASAVAESETKGEMEQMRLATRSLVLARMKAQFEALRRTVGDIRKGDQLRVALDGFATQFSPLLNEAIAEERRDREAAANSVAVLHDRMILLALGASIVATILVVLFHVFLIRPLIARLEQISQAANDIGDGVFDIALPSGKYDELGRLFEVVDRMAGRLKRRREDVDSDRAQLKETIAARTAELSEANARLSHIDAERRRFFADVGHELRTPLTVILAESELVLKDGVDQQEAVDALSIIHSRAIRLNRRIDDLLRVARSETGQIELDSRPFDLAEAANEAVGDMAPLAKRQRVSLKKRLEPAAAVGDADWCRQVVCGLIENAIRHSPNDTVIEIATHAGEGRALLTVTDEGEGLAEGEAAHVFDRFARGVREPTGSGFGVGLALAKWVIGEQSGSIELLSPAPRPPEGGVAQGRGAQVTMHLPTPPADAGHAATGKLGYG